MINTYFFRNSPSLDSFAIVDLFCVCPTFTFTGTGDIITNDVITKQWQLQCVDINKLYNISCYDRKENISHCTYLYHCLSRSLCEKRMSCEKRITVVTAPNDGNAQNVAQPKLRSATLIQCSA